jgi:hypothetical protein
VNNNGSRGHGGFATSCNVTAAGGSLAAASSSAPNASSTSFGSSNLMDLGDSNKNNMDYIVN